jgi:glyoxylase-like metal-dependent hydrolase (beta-lactamase superfamily II)
MLQRRPIFPHVIEINHQAGQILGSNVYLVFDRDEWMLIDIGYEDTVDEIIELIRELDFPLSRCKTIVATHADVDHVQGLAKAKQILRTTVTAHPKAVQPLADGDPWFTFARIPPQEIDLKMPPVAVERTVEEGDTLQVGDLTLDVWFTPGHTNCQLSFRLGELLFSGDNIFRDGSVGAIDAHHGSDRPRFIRSLERIRRSEVQWLLPSHGPYFRKTDQLLTSTIARLQQYQHLADFGTCAVDWPLMDQWEKELAEGWRPD